MWCAACRADVAAELSTDNRRMLCARCQSELGLAAGAADRAAAGPRLQDSERNARELLARWSTQNVLESPVAGNSPTSPPELASMKPRRFDAPHSIPAPNSANVEPASSDRDDAPRRKRRRRTETSASPKLAVAPVETPTPVVSHDDIVRAAVQHSRAGSWTTSVGQLCAYAGVALLTLGTVTVLSGYFGGPANYAPTGWLVSAVGQMLLFLGVVTLVSGGMEQTVDEVAWRIDSLAEHIVHLEQTIVAQQSQLEEAQRLERRRRRRDRGQSDAA